MLNSPRWIDRDRPHRYICIYIYIYISIRAGMDEFWWIGRRWVGQLGWRGRTCLLHGLCFFVFFGPRATFLFQNIVFLHSSLFGRELIRPSSSLFGQVRAYSAKFEPIRPAEYVLFLGIFIRAHSAGARACSVSLECQILVFELIRPKLWFCSSFACVFFDWERVLSDLFDFHKWIRVYSAKIRAYSAALAEYVLFSAAEYVLFGRPGNL